MNTIPRPNDEIIADAKLEIFKAETHLEALGNLNASSNAADVCEISQSLTTALKTAEQLLTTLA